MIHKPCLEVESGNVTIESQDLFTSSQASQFGLDAFPIESFH